MEWADAKKLVCVRIFKMYDSILIAVFWVVFGFWWVPLGLWVGDPALGVEDGVA